MPSEVRADIPMQAALVGSATLRNRLDSCWALLCFACSMAVLSGSASVASSQALTRPSSGATPPVPAWDSLYAARRYFELRESVALWHGVSVADSAESMVLHYFRGLVAYRFDNSDEAVAELAPVAASMPRVLTPDQLARAVDALGQSYLRLYRYRESGEVYALALRGEAQLRGRTQGSPFDSATRVQFGNRAAIGQALGSVLPQRVSWSRTSRLEMIADTGQQFRARVSINGTRTAKPLSFTTAQLFTVLDSTTAAACNVARIARNMTVRSSNGAVLRADVGVIANLGVGPATVNNVVVLVYRDGDMRALQRSGSVAGAVGLTVLNALGRLTFMRGGQIAVSSPGAAPMDTTTGAPFAIGDLGPVAEAFRGGHRLALAIDLSASQSALFPGFLRRFPLAARGDTLAPHGTSGVAGIAPDVGIQIAAYDLRGIDVQIGGRTLRFGRIPALVAPGGRGSAFYAGALGSDVMSQIDAMSFDFAAMTVSLQQRPPPTLLPIISYPNQAPLPSTPPRVPQELAFIALLFALFIVPKALQRYRIPGAITSLVMGAGATGFGWFHGDATLQLLSTLGIVALFLFAGLEIDGHELRRNIKALTSHAITWTTLATATAFVVAIALGVAPRVAALLSLALVTPSTGFILSSLGSFGLSENEQRNVKTYAVASELLALTALFFVLQSTSTLRLIIAVAAMIGVVIVIPLAFRVFAAVVAPYAPRSEFAFLLMVAVVCSYATRRLGVYYLVGAFLVGVAAQRFRGDHPAMSSEKMVNALESFGSVFIPFYFFHAGTEIVAPQLTPVAMGLGVLLLVLFIPIRIAVVALHRKGAMKESIADARRVGTALVPTLVFTLVIVAILHDRFDVSDRIAGALVLYTVLNTTIPGLVLRSKFPGRTDQHDTVDQAGEF